MRVRKFVFILALILTTASAGAQTHFHIKADIPGDSAYVDSVVNVTTPRLEKLLGPIAYDSLDIFVAASEERFDSLTGNALPDWGVGVAIPYRSRIVIKSPLIMASGKTLGELVANEYTHIALSRFLGHTEPPRWINEGMAMYCSAEWGWTDNLAIGWAVVLGRIIPLNEIENLNRFDARQAETAYSESYLAFKYFLDSYGQSGLHILLTELQAKHSIDDALIAATGADRRYFEKEFSEYLRGRYNLVTLFFDSQLIWVLAALIVLLGFVIARIRRRERMNRLDDYGVTDRDGSYRDENNS